MRAERFELPTFWSGVRGAAVAPCPLWQDVSIWKSNVFTAMKIESDGDKINQLRNFSCTQNEGRVVLTPSLIHKTLHDTVRKVSRIVCCKRLWCIWIAAFNLQSCTCGLVAMTSASHAEGRQFDPGQVYFCHCWSWFLPIARTDPKMLSPCPNTKAKAKQEFEAEESEKL